MDFDIEQITGNIYHDIPNLTLDFFAAIKTTFFAGVLGIMALRIRLAT
jgi:hypothetical protein